ncbi:inosine/xanthosine triphosphatase [Skeletonema marinoi]|uniref:inosine/xanthosine triphosphatase n=1 Tax=Skeletonema marinoi TaxID=267567 RepID=A0AAD8XZL5_9STRA|nr:inosine/xanthosine triphosphatase [Skeletonema marinoi]
MTTVRVAVGSGNPCKIEAVRRAFDQIFSSDDVKIVISSHSVPSGVADQPFGDEETRQGAKNRALAAYNAACSEAKESNHLEDMPDFAVGLEGGLEKVVHEEDEELWCMAWMAISLSWGYAKTGSFLLPPALCDLVLNKNMELGHADDVVFRRVNSKHGSGTVGVLTKGEIDRTEYYVHALKLALIPWIRPQLYFDSSAS